MYDKKPQTAIAGTKHTIETNENKRISEKWLAKK